MCLWIVESGCKCAERALMYRNRRNSQHKKIVAAFSRPLLPIDSTILQNQLYSLTTKSSARNNVKYLFVNSLMRFTNGKEKQNEINFFLLRAGDFLIPLASQSSSDWGTK